MVPTRAVTHRNWRLIGAIAIVVALVAATVALFTPGSMRDGAGFTRSRTSAADQPPCMFLTESRTSGLLVGTSAQTVACYDAAGVAHIKQQAVCSTKGPSWLIWVVNCRAWASGPRFNLEMEVRTALPLWQPESLKVRVYLDRHDRGWSSGPL